MLPRKIRTTKIQKQILRPEGADLWIAPVVAKGIYKTTLRWLEGKTEAELDYLDVLILAKAGEHLRQGDPIIGYMPFRKGFQGKTVTVSANHLRYLLGAQQ